jgi:hypothetical protein
MLLAGLAGRRSCCSHLISQDADSLDPDDNDVAGATGT